MSGLALKVSGYTAPSSLNLPKLYADAVIDSGSVYAYDSLSTDSWPSQAAAVEGSNWLNLVDGGDLAVFNKAQAYAAGLGFSMTIASSEYITLPVLAKLTGYNGCFAVGVWLKASAQTQVNTAVFGWYNRGTPAANGIAEAAGGWGMRHASGNSHYLICGDKTVSLSSYADIRQVAIARVKDASGNYFAAFYRNGVRIGLQAMSATMVQPASPPANAVLGDVQGTGDGGFWTGYIGRSWFTRKDFTVEEMDAKVAKDYALNRNFYQ